MKTVTLYVRAVLLFMFVMVSVAASAAYASTIPTGQDAGSIARTATEEKKSKKMTGQLFKEKKEADIDRQNIDKAASPSDVPAGGGAVVYIEAIEVTGATLLSPMEIDEITSPYVHRELALNDLQEIADSLTAAYRERGYVTSVAYLPPQRITDNRLQVAVTEGKVGAVGVSGNEYFNEKQLLRYIELEKGDFFNYDSLRSNINTINEHPDRTARVVLERGAGPQETDIAIQVVDRNPFHATIGYSNYNSRYLERNKYLLELKHNNLFGLDHIGSLEAQLGEAGLYELSSARYVAPLNSKAKLGAYYIHLEQTLGREVSTSEISGEGDIFSLYYTRKLIERDTFTMSINPGFEYKDIDNTVLGSSVGKDDVRIAKLGFDFDVVDRFNGRTILTHEFDYGLKDFMGGLDYKDPDASRVGSGGDFFRTVTNVAHIHPLPKDMALMMRAAGQYTMNNMVSSEQFHIGGATTVRGYPVSEHAGDIGCTLTGELYVPPFFLPKDKIVPFTETTYYDATRFLVFFDWGWVKNHNPVVGETEHETIYSMGPAMRFDIPGKYSVSFDYGFALGQNASDGADSRGYIEVKMYF